MHTGFVESYSQSVVLATTCTTKLRGGDTQAEYPNKLGKTKARYKTSKMSWVSRLCVLEIPLSQTAFLDSESGENQ